MEMEMMNGYWMHCVYVDSPPSHIVLTWMNSVNEWMEKWNGNWYWCCCDFNTPLFYLNFNSIKHCSWLKGTETCVHENFWECHENKFCKNDCGRHTFSHELCLMESHGAHDAHGATDYCMPFKPSEFAIIRNDHEPRARQMVRILCGTIQWVFFSSFS